MLSRHAKRHAHILIVDDEAGMRDFLAFELQGQGFQVVTAGDGEEALGKLKERKFDLVLSDLKMPGMDGLGLLQEIKKIDPGIEVIMLTGYATVETAVEAMKKGAHDFLQKPFEAEELLIRIEKALERGELKVLVALYEASRAIFSGVRLEEIFQSVMDLLQKVLKADEGSLMLLDDKKELTIAASRGLDEKIAKEVHLKIGERIAGWVAKEKEGLLLNGLGVWPQFRDIQPNPRIRSSIIVPLLSGEELLGVLTLNRIANPIDFAPSDLHNASIFASQIAQAIRNAKLYRALEAEMGELKKSNEKLEKAKEELVRSEKLSSLGKLVAGIAHEINNPLTSVLGYSELLLDAGVSDEVKSALRIVFKEAERCRRIVQDLLFFARQGKPQLESVDVGGLVDEVLAALSLEMERHRVRVEKNCADGIPSLRADPYQLKQVFSNILVNAVQALQEVDRQRVVEIAVRLAAPGVLQVVFSDNGPGIPKKVIHRIFDPFFSTKERGGMGMGLSISYGIVHEHGGALTVHSEEGKGASFVIELPVASGEETRGTGPSDVPELVDNWKGKRVLVIEDEAPILALMMTVLKEMGCAVEGVADGEEGYSRVCREDFDLILCDYKLPGMDGVDLLRKIKKRKREMADRFIFVTGFVLDQRIRNFIQENRMECLPKPFSSEMLAQLVSRKMASAGRGVSS